MITTDLVIMIKAETANRLNLIPTENGICVLSVMSIAVVGFRFYISNNKAKGPDARPQHDFIATFDKASYK